MVNVSIARRYARALIEVAAEVESLDQVLAQLEQFATTLDNSDELRDVVLNPAYSRAQRTAVVEGVMKAVGVDTTVLANLIRLLTDRNRLGYLADIARLYRDEADRRTGRLRGSVTTAVPMSKDALQRLEQTLEKLTQRNVVLQSKVDPTLLGGATAQVGSVVYDGSIRAQLDDLRRGLKVS